MQRWWHQIHFAFFNYCCMMLDLTVWSGFRSYQSSQTYISLFKLVKHVWEGPLKVIYQIEIMYVASWQAFWVVLFWIVLKGSFYSFCFPYIVNLLYILHTFMHLQLQIYSTHFSFCQVYKYHMPVFCYFHMTFFTVYV